MTDREKRLCTCKKQPGAANLTAESGVYHLGNCHITWYEGNVMRPEILRQILARPDGQKILDDEAARLRAYDATVAVSVPSTDE